MYQPPLLVAITVMFMALSLNPVPSIPIDQLTIVPELNLDLQDVINLK